MDLLPGFLLFRRADLVARRLNMNKPSSTIQAAGLSGSIVALFFIALAVFAPEYYDRLPPGSSEIIVAAVATIAGYFKKETVLGSNRP